ncbi:PREDICTED: uncharacterized protein LOC106126306 isoform X2 [Papilio xuthus]|uniref:Uncharacterized protein LOC106126306 isoform X2 n=1 Tax=Papilio xuthus TaxID=66420 RepID=A0AAJ6ZUB1_PAPXU|nr:PREDICTED: uncharacterized protein LOC106126306 isoform X2 [Papilio xuthus]
MSMVDSIDESKPLTKALGYVPIARVPLADCGAETCRLQHKTTETLLLRHNSTQTYPMVRCIAHVPATSKQVRCPWLIPLKNPNHSPKHLDMSLSRACHSQTVAQKLADSNTKRPRLAYSDITALRHIQRSAVSSIYRRPANRCDVHG